MTDGQGRAGGAPRPGNGDREIGFGFAAINYAPPGSDYGWGFGYPPLPLPLPPPPPPPPLPPPCLIRPPMFGRGILRPAFPLGVQGFGILKPPVGPPQGPLLYGRGHWRGYGGRAWGGRGRKNLTKEALDADLDEWRLKDKKFGGQSLDADLDEYWRKKVQMSEQTTIDVEPESPEVNAQFLKDDVQKGSSMEAKEVGVAEGSVQIKGGK